MRLLVLTICLFLAACATGTQGMPQSRAFSFMLDATGNVTQRTDARGIVTNYTYDALNRLTGVSYPSDTSLNATLTYDSATGCGTAPKGHLCSVSDAAGTTAYQYDNLGRVTQQKDTHGTIGTIDNYEFTLTEKDIKKIERLGVSVQFTVSSYDE